MNDRTTLQQEQQQQLQLHDYATILDLDENNQKYRSKEGARKSTTKAPSDASTIRLAGITAESSGRSVHRRERFNAITLHCSTAAIAKEVICNNGTSSNHRLNQAVPFKTAPSATAIGECPPIGALDVNDTARAAAFSSTRSTRLTKKLPKSENGSGRSTAAATKRKSRNISINNVRNCRIEIPRTAAVASYTKNKKRNNNQSSNDCNDSKEMVARELSSAKVAASGTVAAATDGATAVGSIGGAAAARSDNSATATGEAATSSVGVMAVDQNHKVILKLPKASGGALRCDEESLGTTIPLAVSVDSAMKAMEECTTTTAATSSSSSSSTRNCSTSGCAEETRKVEPLKINLHSSHATIGSASVATHPKITIKPIVKKPAEDMSDSSSAEDDVSESSGIFGSTAGHSNTTSITASTINHHHHNDPIPKLTIKSTATENSAADTGGGGGMGSCEPHIVPKLTIRSGSEDGGGSHSTIVPKLTIKMSDMPHSPSTSAAGNCNIIASTSSSLHTPPLPKLTIKTSVDGTSESIITTTLSSSSSSLSCSVLAGTNSGDALTATTSSALFATAEQLMTTPTGMHNSKIPKLTIRTGQEHAVIITKQRTEATYSGQAIPKLTIKTKSLDLVEVEGGSLPSVTSSDYHQQEKIPKLTIKTNEVSSTIASIPKLTISMSSHEGSGSGCVAGGGSAPQSPKPSSLVVRQLAVSTRQSDSPERVPRIMISRQEMLAIVNNHCTEMQKEKLVPKLTIKTNSAEMSTGNGGSSVGGCSSAVGSESKTAEKPSKFTIKNHTTRQQGDEKIPKLTIKSIPAAPVRAISSEDDEDEACTSPDSASDDTCASVAVVALAEVPLPPLHTQKDKTVPKLTIKNLSSPKLRMKAVLDDKLSSAAGKKNLKGVVEKKRTRADNALNGGGESNSSQDFCGFNESQSSGADGDAAARATILTDDTRRNSDDMDIDEGLQQHDPKIFNNVKYFANGCDEGDEEDVEDYENTAVGGDLDGEEDDDDENNDNDGEDEEEEDDLCRTKRTLIDTVDLTSTPGSSPGHFSYTDADPKAPPEQPVIEASGQSEGVGAEKTTLLKVWLRNDNLKSTKSASAPAAGTVKLATTVTATRPSLLLSQLTAPPAALKDRVGGLDLPMPQHSHHRSNCLRYPQLTERLMANGVLAQSADRHSQNPAEESKATPPTRECVGKPIASTAIIDSIEILDTPEGSPNSYTHEVSRDDAEVGDGTTDETSNSGGSPIKLHNHRNSGVAVPAEAHLKRHAFDESAMDVSSPKMARLTNDGATMATLTILTNDQSSSVGGATTMITTSPTMIAAHGSRGSVGSIAEVTDFHSPRLATPHRSRKQRHEHLLTVPIEEEQEEGNAEHHVPSVGEKTYDASGIEILTTTSSSPSACRPTYVGKKRGRPKKIASSPVEAMDASVVAAAAAVHTPTNNNTSNSNNNTSDITSSTTMVGNNGSAGSTKRQRASRVQLLRKRLAIDMVDVEQPMQIIDELESLGDRTMRTPMRAVRRSAAAATANLAAANLSDDSATPVTMGRVRKNHKSEDGHQPNAMMPLSGSGTGGIIKGQRKRLAAASDAGVIASLNYYYGSNSSLSSACSSSSFNSTTVTTTAATVSITGGNGIIQSNGVASNSNNASLNNFSSTNATKNGSGTIAQSVSSRSFNVVGEQRHQEANRVNSMLPPTMILSSSDPLPDVVFRPNALSSIMDMSASTPGSCFDYEPEIGGGSLSVSVGDDLSPQNATVSLGRGRGGRGRGRGNRGGRGVTGNARGHRLGRGASAVAKAIALSRPRCVGGLKHTPDPERLKELFSPGPQVFEEDTRMSAEFSQTSQPPLNQQEQLLPPQPTTPDAPNVVRQLDFLNEESQSSIVSNVSFLDPSNVSSLQSSSGSAVKQRPKKKKMEVCVSEDSTEFTVQAIAEYEWPPPKGCCPSKNRDTFMIQEQVALYLGIKSFKRKYPDLPRRQIDMEERNWLQEKGLVSERMCDLGITAIWASDILDIMYTDFYDKYEQYKDFIRQKHLREIERKQKALGLNVNGRGLQARDRALLSTSKWNAYFNKTRKEERRACLDMQTLTINMPLPVHGPGSAILHAPMVEVIEFAAQLSQLPLPPSLERIRSATVASTRLEVHYPVALVPGQFSQSYRHYTPLELRSFPINTVLEHPATAHDRSRHSLFEDSDSGAELPSCQRGQTRRARRRRHMPRPTTAGVGLPNKTGADVKSESSSATSSTSSGSSSESDSESRSSSSVSSCSSSSATNSSIEASDSEGEDVASPPMCSVCQRAQNCNVKDVPELFVACYTCRRKVHPSCVEMPHRMTVRVRNYNWQCADCKCCLKCKCRRDINKMLFCEQCDRGYHIYCLGLKTVPDGRWSCERCSICMRCGATKPEGLPQQQQPLIAPNGEKIKLVKHKKVKWINEYRLDHITKLREHCSMLCVPCARAKTIKRVQISTTTPTTCSGGAGTGGSASSGGIAHAHAVATVTIPTSAFTSTAHHARPLPPGSKLHSSRMAMSPPVIPSAHALHAKTATQANYDTAASPSTTKTTAGKAMGASVLHQPPPPPVVA